MGAASQIRRLLSSFLVERSARRLELEGSAKRAPTYALIQVESSQTGLFELQIFTISKLFDRVFVVWPGIETPSRHPKNVEVFTSDQGIDSRWNLLKNCSDGFVFPISLIKPIQPTHVAHLKRHLFATGGANAVALHNFGFHESLTADEVESAFDLVPMPLVDPDYSILDQRFWKLGGSEFESGTESEALATQAHQRTFGLYACNDALAESSLVKPSTLTFSRFDLIESALRVPKLLQQVTPSKMQLWYKAWDALGAKGDTGSSAELQSSLSELLSKNPSLSNTAKVATRKLLGRKTRPQGARS